MRLFPQSYNGFLFQQSGKVASDFANPYDWNIQGISTNEIPRSGNFPLRVAKNYTGSIKVINVTLLDVDVTRDSLVIAGDVLGEEQVQLISLDEFGRAWYVNADFIGLTEDSTEKKTVSFGAVFAVDDPIWKLLIPSTASIEVDGTGSGVITPIGNQPALPVITVTPTFSGGFGFEYKRFITIVNNSPNALLNYPLDVTDGGLDTAALVGAGKMLASGDDLRIYIDGVEVKRWFGDGGMNNASTTIWVNWTQPANTELTLGANIAGAGDITEISIENTAANVANLPLIPSLGLVLIGSEIFAYTGVDILNLKLTGITRNERQSSPAAHTAADVIDFIQDVWLYYGYPTIAPYVVDDTYKTVLDLINSTNVLHVYADLFRDIAGNRTGAWQESIVLLTSNFPNSHNYGGPQDTFADPAAVIGTYIEGKSIIGWKLYEPCGITDIEIDGQGYSVSSLFGTVLESSLDGVGYIQTIYVFATPSPLSSWQPIGSGPQTLAVTHFYVRIRNFGSVINTHYAEFSDASIALDQVPTISIAAEGAGFITLHSLLANDATGDTLEIEVAMALGTYLVIDTKNRTVTLYDGTNMIGALINMPVRAEWFRLLPAQPNTISITEAGEVTFAFSYEDRSL